MTSLLAATNNTWLCHADRQCWPLLLQGLAAFRPRATDELGEGWRGLSFPSTVWRAALESPALARCAFPVMFEFPSRDFGRAPESAIRAVLTCLRALAARERAEIFLPFPLRRHGRFTTDRLRSRLADLGLTPYDSSTHRHVRCLFIAASDTTSYAGVATPHEVGSLAALLPDDTLRERKTDPSRACAKLSEALVILAGHGVTLPPGARVLELGAYPGGMTSELVRRGLRVKAVDVNPANEILRTLPGVDYECLDVTRFKPASSFAALVCDVNGPAAFAVETLCRLAPCLVPGAPLIYTIKLATWDSWPQLASGLRARLCAAGFELLAVRHLQANRQELTAIGIFTS